MLKRSQSNRRAFTIVIVPLVLGITLVILGVIYAVQNQTPITPNGPRPLSIKVVSGVTVIAGWFIVMASGWAEKRGQKSANIFFGVILLLFNLAMLNAVTGWSASMRAKHASAPVTPMQPPSLASAPLAPPASISESNPAATTDRSSDSAPSVTPPAPRSKPQRRTAPQTDTAPATGATPTPVPAPIATPAPAPPVDLEPIASQLAGEINTEIAKRAGEALEVYKIIEKPKRDRKQIDAQLTTLRETEQQLKKTSSRLRDVMDEFRSRAEAISPDAHNVTSRAMKLNRDVEAFARSNACDSVGRACASGIEFLTILRDNLGKWAYNDKGEFTTRDKTLEHQIFVPKARVGHAISDKPENLRVLGAQ